MALFYRLKSENMEEYMKKAKKNLIVALILILLSLYLIYNYSDQSFENLMLMFAVIFYVISFEQIILMFKDYRNNFERFKEMEE